LSAKHFLTRAGAVRFIGILDARAGKEDARCPE
jgi:hypothetical protein